MEIQRRGIMLVMSSASGAGKTTLSRRLLAADSGIVMSVSATTRPQRPGEVEGSDYYFLDDSTFDDMLREEKFLEHATVFGRRYGTPRAPVDEALEVGRDVLFDIDWQGAQQLRQKAWNDVVSIFILPPSMRELERRLTARAQDTETVVRQRMQRANEEIGHWQEYDYVVINDDAEAALQEIAAIVTAERLRRERRIGLLEFVDSLRRGAS